MSKKNNSLKNDNVVKITDTDFKISKIINSLQHTLRRMGSMFGYGISPDGKRNYNQIFGYGEQLSYADYFGMYKRSAIGRTVVDKVAKACWGEIPEVKSDDKIILEEQIDILNI